MTSPDDFSADEWALLKRTPTTVAIAAAYAEGDGMLALSREMRAGLKAASDAAAAFPDNAIIQALNVGMQEVDEENDDLEGGLQGGEASEDDVIEERNPSLAGESSLDLAGDAMDVMLERATEREAVEFKHWLYAIADQVTLSQKSGGFLGFGGTQVSESEASYLAQLRAAIGLESKE